jgi:ABC-type siderophore export system fused ATPase/permease subunit
MASLSTVTYFDMAFQILSAHLFMSLVIASFSAFLAIVRPLSRLVACMASSFSFILCAYIISQSPLGNIGQSTVFSIRKYYEERCAFAPLQTWEYLTRGIYAC